jgi:hypothetical protein
LLAFVIALGIALADLLAVWLVLPTEPLRGSTADSVDLLLQQVEQPESTYGSNGAAYGRICSRSYTMELIGSHGP